MELLGVVGQRHEIKRPGQLDRLAGGGGQRLAPGEPIGVLLRQPVAKHEAVVGQGGVDVQVAEVGVVQRVAGRPLHRRHRDSGARRRIGPAGAAPRQRRQDQEGKRQTPHGHSPSARPVPVPSFAKTIQDGSNFQLSVRL